MAWLHCIWMDIALTMLCTRPKWWKIVDKNHDNSFYLVITDETGQKEIVSCQ